MAVDIEQILQQALTLDENDRAQLAGRLLESLEPAEEDVEEAWRQEIARRLKELDSGAVQPIPWEEASARIFGRRSDRGA
jgi:putative addiction module component (TIGR02574 family)